MLNADILLVVASFCDGKTLSAIIGSCKAMYHSAARYALKHDHDGALFLMSEEDIAPFIRFMDPDDGIRWGFLQGLSIAPLPLTPETAAAFASSLSKATNLQKLNLKWCEEILELHPAVHRGLVSLPSVKHLELCDPSVLMCRLMEEMRWPLESASFVRHRSGAEFDTNWEKENLSERMNPALLFKNTRHTLQSLTLLCWGEYAEDIPEPPVYPAMKSFTMKPVSFPQTAPWAKSYPNLEHLTVTTSHWLPDLDEHAITGFAECRRRNLERHASQGIWGELQAFDGDILGLYLVGIPCRIWRLRLHVHSEELRFLSDVFLDARPTALHLHIAMSMFEHWKGDYAWLADCLRASGLRNVRELTVTLLTCLPNKAEPMLPNLIVRRCKSLLTSSLSLTRPQDCLLSVLPSISLETLTLEVNAFKVRDRYYDQATETIVYEQLSPACPTELFLRTLVLEDVAARFLRASESLESVQVHAEFRCEGVIPVDKHLRMTREEL